MNSRTAKSPLKLLLDANIIIKANDLGFWQNLLDCTEIVVPSIVARREALFYSHRIAAVPTQLNLPRLIQAGRLHEASATAGEMMLLAQIFDDVFIETIHDGEKEALVLLHARRLEGCLFCTADRAAICALAMLGLSEVGISLETVLKRVGLQRPLPRYFCETFFNECLERGKQKRLLHEGLR